MACPFGFDGGEEGERLSGVGASACRGPAPDVTADEKEAACAAREVLEPDIFACVIRWDLRFVLCANRRLQDAIGHTYGRSPVWMRMCVRRLKSSEKRFPQPSNVHYTREENRTEDTLSSAQRSKG